jgi:hypothetical protein
MSFPGVVYVLCFITCAICTGLLTRAWWRTRTGLLLWTAASFACLALNNFLVVLDLVVFAEIDLSIFRSAAALAAGMVMVVGFIWEAD